MHWAAAVTTCPQRADSLLPSTLDSLAAAGFTEPLIRCDTDRLGPQPHWHLTALELFYRHRFASHFALFQDDCVLVRNVRQYVEAHPLPDNGWANLTSHGQNEHLAVKQSLSGWYPSNQRSVGAVGLILPRQALLAILGSPHLLDYATDPKNPRRFPRYLDGGLKFPLIAAGFVEYCHYPSLLQHTGTHSTIANKTWPKPIGDSFPGQDFDALTWLEH